MNRTAIGAAVGTLAVVTVVIFARSRRERVPEFSSPSAVAVEDALRPSEIKLEVEASPRPANVRTHATLQAVRESVASTVRAFSLEGDDADYAAHDERAQADAKHAEREFLSIRSQLAPDVARRFEDVIDQLRAAQVQLMAFAINRKNRGTPDASQLEAERADRKAFETDVRPLLDQLKAAVG